MKSKVTIEYDDQLEEIMSKIEYALGRLGVSCKLLPESEEGETSCSWEFSINDYASVARRVFLPGEKGGK